MDRGVPAVTAVEPVHVPVEEDHTDVPTVSSNVVFGISTPLSFIETIGVPRLIEVTEAEVVSARRKRLVGVRVMFPLMILLLPLWVYGMLSERSVFVVTGTYCPSSYSYIPVVK